MTTVDTIVLGAGARGRTYASYALTYPDRLRVVAVAEPRADVRARFADAHAIPPERQFAAWEDLLARPQMARAAIIATPDHLHTAPTLAALEAGYDVLLEKPMAPTLAENVRLVQAAERAGRTLQICHVLRYTSLFTKVREIVQSGRLGQLITVEQRENVAFWHMAHSFVRGNWCNAAESSPMILAKCCHDLDVLHWILGRRAERISSVGSLIHFRAENAPPGAPPRCTDGCPAQDVCPFYAPSIYIEQEPLAREAGVSPWLLREYDGWPRSVVSADVSPAALRRALETGPYGRCVYHCDNNVVDHQVVSMAFEDGISVTLIMHGHSHEEGRTMRYDGSRATLLGAFGHGGMWVEMHDHRSGDVERYDLRGGGGHGGGDNGLMGAFIDVLNGKADPLTSARASLESHLMAFAAEEARLSATVVRMDDFRARAEAAG